MPLPSLVRRQLHHSFPLRRFSYRWMPGPPCRKEMRSRGQEPSRGQQVYRRPRQGSGDGRGEQQLAAVPCHHVLQHQLGELDRGAHVWVYHLEFALEVCLGNGATQAYACIDAQHVDGASSRLDGVVEAVDAFRGPPRTSPVRPSPCGHAPAAACCMRLSAAQRNVGLGSWLCQNALAEGGLRPAPRQSSSPSAVTATSLTGAGTGHQSSEKRVPSACWA